MEKWDYKQIDFSDCVCVSDAVDKYVMYREITPVDYLPYLDWQFFYNGVNDKTVGINYCYYYLLKKLREEV